MVKRVVKSIVLLLCATAGALILFVLARDSGRTAGPPRFYVPAPELKLIEVKRPDPIEDFIRLRKLFKDHNGALVSRDDRIAKWKDTCIFRMFEFKHHTVVIFPYNWNWSRKTGAASDLIIFAGHVKDYSNLFDSVFYHLKGEDGDYYYLDEEGEAHPVRMYYYNKTMNLDITPPALQDVSFEGFHLGERREDVVKKQTAYIRSYRASSGASAERPIRRLNIRNLTDEENWGAGDRDSGYFCFFFEDGKVAYVNWWTAMPGRLSDALTWERLRRIGAYSDGKPVTPVLAEGQFEIPKEE